MDEDKKLKQLLASAQQELNRLTSSQKYLSRKEKTHRKVVLGGEVVKFMGIDVDHDVVIGYLKMFSRLSERQIETLKIKGAEERRRAGIKKLKGRSKGKNTKSDDEINQSNFIDRLSSALDKR